MAKKEQVLLSGVGKWMHKLFTPDQYEDNDPRYTMSLYPDETSREIFLEKKKQYKLANRVRDDEDGSFVNFGRPHLPKSFNGKIIFAGGPPKVVDADGNVWNAETIIGNGSEVDVLLDIYATKKNGGSRILKVTVRKLVEYEAPEQPSVQAAEEPVVPFE